MNVRELLRTYRTWARALTLSVVLASLSAFAEATTLVLVGPLAQLVADRSNRFEGSLGPLELDLARRDLILLAIGATVVSLVLQILSAWVRGRIVGSYERVRRAELIDAYLRADLDLQARDREGRLQTRYAGFVNQGSIAVNNLVQLIRSGLSMFVLFASSLVISPLFAGLIALFGVGLTIVTRPLIRAARRIAAELADAQLAGAEEVAETTASIREITTFGVQDAASADVGVHSRELSGIRRRQIFVQYSVSPVYQSLGLLVIVGTLALATNVENIDLAEFGAVAILLLRSVSYGQQLQTAQQKLNDALPYLEQLDDFIESFRRARRTFGDKRLDRVETLRLESVAFTYPALDPDERQQPALRDVSLSLRAGESIGLVGPSGSGKSTLAQVLLRLRVPDEGSYLVNGIPATDYDEKSWSRQAALVPQEARLVHGTISDNIRFRRGWITDDALTDAARRAGIHDTIVQLPNGYDTPMGASVRMLSGGQVQRLSIARALAGAPSLMVFDEPTSALDVESELVIRDTISELDDVVRVVIAHRLSTLDACDRLLVLIAGRVIDDGPRAEVLGRSEFLRGARERGSLDAGAETP